MISRTLTASRCLRASCRQLPSAATLAVSSFHSSPCTNQTEHGSSKGIVFVRDQMFPTSQKHSDDLFRHARHPKTVSIIGAPMTYGQPFHGTDSAPRQLREAGLRTMLTSLGWRVEDVGDMDLDNGGGGADKTLFLPNAKNSIIVGAGTALLADVVESKINEGNFPLILGGDHSIGIGSMAGILKARPDTGFLWIDAHADLNTPENSGSGNLHGMPVGLHLNGFDLDYDKYPGLEWLADTPRLNPDSIVYVGLRDVDPAEREAIRNMGIQAYTMHDIDHYGIGSVMDMAFNHLLKENPHRPLHLSYDIDAIDPLHAPATGTAVRGGLTFREAHFVAEFAAQSGNLASAEMVELNHTLSDGEGAKDTVDLGLQIVTSLMGKSII